MTRVLRVAVLAMAVGGAVGCAGGGATRPDRPGVQARYNDFVDPNWPLRYSYPARESVLHPLDTQVRNAEIVEATVANFQFEAGTDKLTEGGKQKLDAIARRGLCADGHLYLQTSRDVKFDPENPTKQVIERAELDARRGQAVLAYMAAQPGGKAYDITPIDPRDTSISSVGPASAVRGLSTQYRAGITGAAGLPLTGVGGGPAAGAPNVPSAGQAGAGGGTTINTAPPAAAPADGGGTGGAGGAAGGGTAPGGTGR